MHKPIASRFGWNLQDLQKWICISRLCDFEVSLPGFINPSLKRCTPGKRFDARGTIREILSHKRQRQTVRYKS